MRRVTIICLVLALVAVCQPALARLPQPGGFDYVGAPRKVYDDPAPPPYPMTYSEEIAHALGARNGGIALTQGNGRDLYSPAVSVGSGAGAPMLKLQWRGD